MPQAVKSTLLLYVDDSCILYLNNQVDEIKKQLNKNFENICDWLLNKKLSIHFGEDKTKSVLFASKQRSKNVRKLSIRYKHINIKQHSKVTYLLCVLDEIMSNKPMALKVINKINRKLNFLCRKKNRCLTKEPRRILWNALFQPHFDYVCPAWYPNLNGKTKKKI